MKELNRASVESDLNRHHVQYEDPLWKEDEAETKNRVISVKLCTTKNLDYKLTEWKFFDNGKLAFILTAQYMSKKQLNFLHTVDGVQFLMKVYKAGATNASKIRTELKKTLC